MDKPRKRIKSHATIEKDRARMARNFKTVSCCTKREEAEAFSAYCEAKGKSVRQVLLEYIRDCIKETAGD